MRFRPLLLAAFLGGCGSIDGQVRDAGTGRPVANALVKVSTIGWGRRDGQLVWDAETVHETRTDADGRFLFKGIDGGGRLQVHSPVGVFDHGSLCPKSPMTVWVGGPNQGVRTDRPLVLGDERARASFGDRRALSTEQLGITMSMVDADDGRASLRVEAPRGAAFIEGTGSIPKWPDPDGFKTALEVDPARQCGWFFVYTHIGRAVIEARQPDWAQNPGEEAVGIALFTLLRP